MGDYKSSSNGFSEGGHRLSNGKSSLYEVPMTDDGHDEGLTIAERDALRLEAALSVLDENEVLEDDPLQPQKNGEPAVRAPPRVVPPRPGLTPQRVLLTPGVRVTKGEEVAQQVEVGSHQPGAYQIQGRAFGAIPMWARVRQASRALRSARSTRLFTSNMEREDSDRSVVLNARGRREESYVADESPNCVPNDDNEDDEKNRARKSRIYCWSAIMVVLVLGAIAAGVGAGFALRRTVSKPAPPKDPKCDFTGQSQPDIFLQCECFDTVNIISPEVANSYNELLRNNTLGMNFNNGEPIGSCAPVNVAKLWIAQEIGAGITEANSQRLLNRYVLVVIFIHWGGPNWSHNERWLTHENECSWYGISCQKQNITSLSLSNNSIASGSRIPPELFLLTALGSLQLANNSLTGNVSSAISALKNLENLCLAGNVLTGSFPFAELASLTKLRALDISENTFVGALPDAIGNLTTLEMFSAPWNMLSGSLPSELGLLTKLVLLDFSYCAFTGSLPTEIGKMTDLEYFHISGRFQGSIPTEVTQLTNLRYLEIVGGSLAVGTIPSQIGALSHLAFLQLHSSSFSGAIPTSLARCTSLTFLELYGNSLTGTIPSELGLLSRLVYLDLSGNRLTGHVPEELFQNRNIKSLTVASNPLDGSFPTNVENATSLACLDVTKTSLEGSVPSGLCSLKGIKQVAVDCSIFMGCECCDCSGSGVCADSLLVIDPSIRPNISVAFPCG